MVEKVKKFLLEFMTAVQSAKIYTLEHPKFIDFIDKSYKSLQDILEEKKEVIIGIVDEEIAFEQEIFFDISHKVRSLIKFFKERGIERIIFNQQIKREELANFISFLIYSSPEKQIDSQGYFSLPGIINIKAGKIKAPKPYEKKKKKAQTYKGEDSLKEISLTIEKVLNEDDIDYLDLRFNLIDFMENFADKYEEFLYLISIKRKDLITFLHLLNVSLLSMYFSSKIGFSKDNVLDIGIAALFHDIGKISVSRRILKKKEKLDDEEFSMIKNHSLLGTRIMLRYKDTLGILPPVITFEHHIRYDLKGYPELAFPRRPHLASMIVSLCDVYDALSQRRIYKRDFPPLKIYKIMKNERGRLFHPRLFDKFFKIMGVWPVGTIISLKDGRIAVVREVNEDDIFHPKIEVIVPKRKREFINLAEKKKMHKIKGSLNPFGEGKKYVRLI